MENKATQGNTKTLIILIILAAIFIQSVVNSFQTTSKYNKLKEDYQNLQSQYATIEKENLQLTSENERLKDKYNTIQKLYTDIKDKYNSLTQYNLDKIDDLEKARDEMLEIQREQQEQNRIIETLQTEPTNLHIDELLSLYKADGAEYNQLNNTHIVLTAYVKTECTNGNTDKAIYVDDEQMQSFFGSEIEFMDAEDAKSIENLKRYDLVVIDGIADTSGATFKMNNCQLKQWTKQTDIKDSQDSQEHQESGETFIKSHENAQYTDTGAQYQKEVQAAELLKLSENKNFKDVPFNGATAEIYNEYNGEIVKVTGTVQDIQGNNIFLDCDDKGYNTVGANTASVVYYVAQNPQDFSVGEQVQVVGKAYCYTYAIVIK